MADKTTQPRDVNQIVRYLTNMFNIATLKMDRPVWTTTKGANDSYQVQTEFAYLLNEVMMGPPCLIQKNISACNEFIDQMNQRNK